MSRLLEKIANRFNRMAGVSLERTYLYCLRKSATPEVVTAEPSINWELLPPGKTERLSDIGPFGAKDGADRFRRGDVCYVAFLDNRPAHYSWVQRSGCHAITEAGIHVPVKGGELWIYHCITAEWARGKGIYPATLKRIITDHFGEGCHAAWIYTSQENIASQKGISRAGFGLVDILTSVRVGSHYFRIGPARQGQ